jgi:hypothetical protein
MSSIFRHDGELCVDHRASPGLPSTLAQELGMVGEPTGEGSVAYFRVLACNHCGGAQLMNPLRTRDRGYCRLCDHYICDVCEIARKEAGYIHRTIDELTELITSGRWTFAEGSTAARPILVRTEPETRSPFGAPLRPLLYPDPQVPINRP